MKMSTLDGYECTCLTDWIKYIPEPNMNTNMSAPLSSHEHHMRRCLRRARRIGQRRIADKFDGAHSSVQAESRVALRNPEDI